jgi:S-adenosylmethionine:tRNA ribosyltransferase-isomerase
MRPQISIDRYDYNLPDKQIAKYPLQNREDSKLLIYNNGSLSQSEFKNIATHLPQNSLLVFNNTKVIRARLSFQKSTGANIEIFCLEPSDDKDIQITFNDRLESVWTCIIGNLKKWKQGSIESKVKVGSKIINVEASRISGIGDAHRIKFAWNDETLTFGELIEAMGKIPIPPYLNRDSEPIDGERYQTVYSQHKGSVAAPTAGLHFTSDILNEIRNQNIKTVNITLHVGAGTFKPVKSDTIDNHEMHVEHFVVSRKTINELLEHEGDVIAVGTTTTRTLESLYWLGYKLSQRKFELKVEQWDPYECQPTLTFKQSLQYIINYLNSVNSDNLPASTGIMIAPGYEYKAIDGLITNFHQPKSTLLLLLAALIGDDWKQIYDYALGNDFRFLSYGDSSIILKDKR